MDSQPICRLCLEESNQLVEIHSKVGEELKIYEIVSQHLCFDVKPDDQISNKMCLNCWNKLEDFHSFYNKIHNAQERITVIYDENISQERITVIYDTCLGELQEKNDSKHSIEKVDEHIAGKEDEDGNEQVPIELKIESRLEDKADENFTFKEACDTEVANVEDQKDFITSSDTEKNQESPVQVQRRITRRAKKRNGLSRICRYSSKNKDNNSCDSNLVEDIDYNDDPIEYSAEKKLSSKMRKPVKKDILEAEKEKAKSLIESYYKMKCELCHENLEKFEALFDHYPARHSVRGFIFCCGKKFFKRTVIAEHVTWHIDPDLFKCNICEKIYADRRCLNNHMLLHAPPDMKLFKCNHCPKSFVKKFKLEQHKLCHLSPEEKKYLCNECHKPYASDALLRAHKRVVHQKTYAHMCEICAKLFKSRVFFEKHQLEHLGQNLPRVQCQICCAWMKNEHSMRAHMRLHQDAGMIHKCEICGKQSPSRNAILKHKRFVHLSEKKFKCTLCDKAFKRAITLKEHMTVHTGEVLYTCTFCPKTFNSGANMHAHRKKAHPVEWEKEKRAKQLLLKPEGCT